MSPLRPSRRNMRRAWPSVPPGPSRRDNRLGRARFLAERLDDLPIGLLYCDPGRPTYGDFVERGLETGIDEKLDMLNKELDRFTV